MTNILNSLTELLPDIKFEESKKFYWSPQTKTIFMNSSAVKSDSGMWALLHESGHALLGHKDYKTDAGLLMLEVEAWESALKLSKKLEVDIDLDHIQECLNTYRDWLYARSTCPTCALNSLQIDQTAYMCLNCSTRWSVSQSRFCRPYRMQDRHKKSQSEHPHPMFG